MPALDQLDPKFSQHPSTRCGYTNGFSTVLERLDIDPHPGDACRLIDAAIDIGLSLPFAMVTVAVILPLPSPYGHPLGKSVLIGDSGGKVASVSSN